MVPKMFKQLKFDYMVIFLYNLYILVWIKGGCIAIMDFALDSGKTFTWLTCSPFFCRCRFVHAGKQC